MVILPALSTSTREIPTPAAATARMIRVTSCCRNVEGARAIGLLLRSLLIARHASLHGFLLHLRSSKLSPGGPRAGRRSRGTRRMHSGIGPQSRGSPSGASGALCPFTPSGAWPLIWVLLAETAGTAETSCPLGVCAVCAVSAANILIRGLVSQ